MSPRGCFAGNRSAITYTAFLRDPAGWPMLILWQPRRSAPLPGAAMSMRWGYRYFKLWVAVSLAWAAIAAVITIATPTSKAPPASAALHCTDTVQQAPTLPPLRPTGGRTDEQRLSVVNAHARAQQECTGRAILRLAALQAEQKRNSIQKGLFALFALPFGTLALGLTLAWILKGFGPLRLST
jgi:hypothetical protein